MSNSKIDKDISITSETDVDLEYVAASAKAVKSVNDKVVDLDSRLNNAVDIKELSELTKEGARNGWYSIDDIALAGITSNWIIAKFGTLYTATSTIDPRIVLNSVNPTDTTKWYSPYAYWHA